SPYSWMITEFNPKTMVVDEPGDVCGRCEFAYQTEVPARPYQNTGRTEVHDPMCPLTDTTSDMGKVYRVSSGSCQAVATNIQPNGVARAVEGDPCYGVAEPSPANQIQPVTDYELDGIAGYGRCQRANGSDACF